jgi:prepilin-type N-terminal cleavage/methylation domain-containing protein
MSKKAFTLVEMMIVVAIIAVLAGVALPQYQKYIRKSQSVEYIKELKSLANAQSIYKSINGKYLGFSFSSYDGSFAQKLAFDILTYYEPRFGYDYTVRKCEGTIPGIILKIGNGSDKHIYYVIPSNITLNNTSDKTLLDNGFYTYDYINNTNSTTFPECP